MPVIDEAPELAFNMSELMEEPSVSLDLADNILASAPAALGPLNQQQYVCPAHPEIDRWVPFCLSDIKRHTLTWDNSCICHGVLDWDYLPGTKPDVSAEEPDYSRFENFIPRSAETSLITMCCY